MFSGMARQNNAHGPPTHGVPYPRHVVHAGKGGGPGTAAVALQPGCLVDCERDRQHVLALVAEPHGKKNWWIVDQVSTGCVQVMVLHESVFSHMHGSNCCMHQITAEHSADMVHKV
jgi:hypothetical protein